MRNYSEDDGDSWLDDGSVASTDDLSSNTGDIDNDSIADSDDFEFLSRSSSHVQTEEEGEETDSEFIPPRTPSVTTGSIVSNDEIMDPVSDAADNDERIADSLLESHELPRVVSSAKDMDDSTSTIVQIPRERRDTVTQTPRSDEAQNTSSKPFNVLYAGSSSLKPAILRKLAQALMAAVLKDKSDIASTPSSTSAADWSSGYTSVVPITDFDSANSVPEVEFVEESLVKMRLTHIDSLQCSPSRLPKRFQCQLNQNTQVVSCYHFRHNQTCSWFENLESYPSLLVYCSPTRGETASLTLQKVISFAQTHHIPLLLISDWEKSWYNYRYSFNESNIPILKSKSSFALLGYTVVTPKKFLSLDSAALGLSLFDNATMSRSALESSKNVPLTLLRLTNFQTSKKLSLEKRIKFRIAITALLALLLLFFNLPRLFPNSAPPVLHKTKIESSYPLAKTPSIKELKTTSISTATVTLTSLPTTVTVVEEKTVTVPIFHTWTKTVTTSTSSQSQRHAKTVSTIHLEPITASVSVAKASLVPYLEDVEYTYQLAFKDDMIQVYLDTVNSVLIRVPTRLPDFSGKTPKIIISVRREDQAIPVEIREFKDNMAFITWPKDQCYDQLEVQVYTKPDSVLEAKVIVDYSQPLIDPKLWELLSQSQREAWRRMSIFSGKMDRKMKAMASQVKSRATDPTTYERLEEMAKRAKKVQHEILLNAERQMNLLASKYKTFSNEKLSGANIEQLKKAKEQLQQQVGEYVRIAEDEALKVSHEFMKTFFPPGKGESRWVKRWYEAVERSGKVGKSWRHGKSSKTKHRR